MRTRTASILCVLAALLASCSGLKYATEQMPLFAGFEVKWVNAPVQERKDVTAELEAVVVPQPNRTVFGRRPSVALHNMVKDPGKTTGLRNTLRNKIGTVPIYMDAVPLKDINAAFVNRLNNRGYFAATSSFEVERHGNTANVVFRVDAGVPHRLRIILYADSTDTLNMRIARTMRTSTLKPGDLYDLAVLTAERARVAGVLRNSGYYKLKADDLVWAADTSVGDHQVDVALRVKITTDDEARRRYRLGRIYVHGDRDELLAPIDTVLVDSVHYINYLNNFRPRTITRGVFLREGDRYSARAEENTTRYLSGYGVFRSTNIRFTEDTAGSGILRTDVLLVPQKRWSDFTELNAISKSNNFAGPGVKVGFKDRDLFRGAELFTADLNGRFETQVAGAQKGTNAYELGGKLALQLPRIVPFRFLRTARSYVPTTRFELGYGLFRRIDLYGLESFNSSFSYVWRQNARIWHDLRLLDVSYSKLYFSSDVFETFLNANPSVRRSFDEQFIVGTGYTFTISTRQRDARKGYTLLSLGADEGGNLLSLFFRPGGPVPEQGYLLFNQRFSQFVRFRPEVRYYRPLGSKGDKLVARLLVNAGIPYGNSDVMPYVKQFFSGGTNSLRAFRARSVGPGTYVPQEGSTIQIDQVGDIKFEANLEYRFTIAGYFKGALFSDAGNVWLVHDDPQRPGGKFVLSRALDELAMGAGFGLRFDPDVIVVRLDMATPLRSPALPKGDRWVFDDLRPKVLDNVVFNIAIGYPF